MTAKHELFRSLHVPGTPLRLPNAWDVASARVIEDAGAQAIATTSAGVAWGMGEPDGDRLEPARILDLMARIAGKVEVPVTADIESGSDNVGEFVTGLWQAGVVGINIEDGARPPAELAARIRIAHEAAPELFINARIDTFLFGLGDPETRLQATVDRAAEYISAGASGIFVPGVTDLATIETLASAISAPVNTMAGFGAPSVDAQAEVGVARVSLGGGIAGAAYALARDSAHELLSRGTYSLLGNQFDYGLLNKLLS
ncbi:isocitrate lyase/phosphoenolpyruvate mutase family protein [Actinocrispum sp. NPDC049592]|uniref:isocitrate lyase/PEP mutase family protein n=1 Tax=Actinocrispum sp. NPDC049592 TaxID=3154835 RepID=UPI00342A15B3